VSLIDIDRDAAHDAAQRELSKPIYPRGSLTDQLLQWLDDLLFKIMSGGASVPGGWLTITVLLILAAVAVFVAVRVARRTMRTNRGRTSGLFGAVEMSSAEHRAAAEASAARRDWASAIRHRVRAVARHLEETAVLGPVPGRTATELARDAGQAIPGLAGELRRAATAFNDVTYGELPGNEPAYRMTVDLDRHLLAHASGAQDDQGAASAEAGWAEVR
jgi:type IV secretory pathway TrbL component